MATVGLEIHQQLDTGRKLFCPCGYDDSPRYTESFRRRLRASSGETGATDRAALFEESKRAEFEYRACPSSSCAVERDEEPPRAPDPAAVESALLIAGALRSRVFDQLHPMRKTVVDGSNTSGFQRTMLVSEGGAVEAGGDIPIQSVCLEEDAARKIEKDTYGLERLGVPLVEIATGPFEAEPGRTRQVALALGRLLRATGRVRRGIGTIRQDVNVSVGGAVVEVKGVQQLDQLEKVVRFEAARQRGLLEISGMVKKSGWARGPWEDVSAALQGTESEVLSAALGGGQAVLGSRFAGMAGIFGHCPSPGVRLGRDVAEVARAMGLGGLLHSDELPGHGVAQEHVDAVSGALSLKEGDAFVLLAAAEPQARAAAEAVAARIEQVRDGGVPADTRLATPAGQTVFMRPRPGAARMYPETDVPVVVPTAEQMRAADRGRGVSWEGEIAALRKTGLNAQLAEQVFDSGRARTFEKICGIEGVEPNHAASVICSTVTGLARRGLDAGRLGDADLEKVFGYLGAGKMPKESVEQVLEKIMGGADPASALESASSGALSGQELRDSIAAVLQENPELAALGERAAGPLMGKVMARIRGKAPGDQISRIVREMLKKKDAV